MMKFSALILGCFLVVGCSSVQNNINRPCPSEHNISRPCSLKHSEQDLAYYCDRSWQSKIGWSALSFVASVPYSCGKLAYAVGGSVIAGGVYGLSLGYAEKTAQKISIQAINGSWVVHPMVFTGEKSLRFIGVHTEGGCLEGHNILSIP